MGGLAAATLLIGMGLAFVNVVGKRTIGLIMAFGAGALMSAVAYQLLPDASTALGHMGTVGGGIAAGALTFYFADKLVDRAGGADRKDLEGAQAKGSGVAILLGSLLDAIPESMILGLSLATSPNVSFAFLFAVAASNIPEGLGGTSGMLEGGWKKSRIAWLWLAVVGLSMVAAGAGYGLSVIAPGIDGAFINAFGAGALLVMLTDAMIPEAFEHGGNEAGLALVLGFAIATVFVLANTL